jgi:hypothetical protein
MATCSTAPFSEPSFQMLRPFFAGDANELAASFERWETFPPCTLDADGRPTTPGLPVPMILYFARDINDDAHSDVRATLDPIIHNKESDCRIAPKWRKCFTTISLLGANLTASQDQYHNRMTDPSWNRGPNIQFYRAVRHIDEQPSSTSKLFYYMEGDNEPLADNWLDAIATEIEEKSPFSVLGGRYAGHNWDVFGDKIIVPSLRNHLNGNGVYNVDHTLLQLALERFDDSPGSSWEDKFHSSFDVYLSEILIDEMDVSVDDLETAGKDYKQSSVLTNFATTLTLPQALPPSARVVHGASSFYLSYCWH